MDRNWWNHLRVIQPVAAAKLGRKLLGLPPDASVDLSRFWVTLERDGRGNEYWALAWTTLQGRHAMRRLHSSVFALSQYGVFIPQTTLQRFVPDNSMSDIRWLIEHRPHAITLSAETAAVLASMIFTEQPNGYPNFNAAGISAYTRLPWIWLVNPSLIAKGRSYASADEFADAFWGNLLRVY